MTTLKRNSSLYKPGRRRSARYRGRTTSLSKYPVHALAGGQAPSDGTRAAAETPLMESRAAASSPRIAVRERENALLARGQARTRLRPKARRERWQEHGAVAGLVLFGVAMAVL